MFAHIRSALFAINASYWFYPALFATTGFVLGIVMVELDRRGFADWISQVSVLHPARPDGASNMLTVLAGSMIGVASTVFSITIAAVAYASGTYGPRLLTNFMENKGNQLSLATFIGTFVYAITVLRTVRTPEESAFLVDQANNMQGFVPQLALLVGFGLMILSVGVLVYFLHHIPSSIRINSVLEGIGRGLLDLIARRYAQDGVRAASYPELPDGEMIRADDTGYIRFVNLSTMAEIAKKAETVVALKIRSGDFVQPGTAIAQIGAGINPQEIEQDLLDCLALGGSRTPEQDLEFSIDELVEIAQRALSPGINDPFTAITALHWLGAATTELGHRNLSPDLSDDSTTAEYVIPLNDDFEHFVKRGFGATRAAVASHKLSALVALDCLAECASHLDDETRVAVLGGEAKLLMQQAETELQGPELDEVRARFIVNFPDVAG